MPRLRYKAIGVDGGSIRGTITANDRNDAYHQLTASGLKPLWISNTQGFSLKARTQRISAKDLSRITYQLAVLLEAGIAITEALRLIANQEKNQRLCLILDQMASSIASGESITGALRPHRNVFGDVYIETIHAAEINGNTVKILNILANLLERQDEIIKKVKGAMMYPLCVMVALVLALVFLLTFVIPRFEVLFASRGEQLPGVTLMVLFASQILRNYWYAFVLGGIASMALIPKLLRQPVAQHKIDHWLHRLPLVASLLKAAAISRFTSVLGISLDSGLNLLDSLEMSARASGRPLLQTDIEKIVKAVGNGHRLSYSLKSCDYLTPFTVQMISAGEEAGSLPDMCQIITRYYDREVDYIAKSMATAVEPIMTIGLAAVVLIIALAVFLPMWGLSNVHAH